VKKLISIRDSIILGVSGPVGLGQLFEGSIHQLWDQKKLSGKDSIQGREIIRDSFRPHIIREFACAAETRKAIGDQAAVQGILSSTVVALSLSRAPCLFQFDHQGAPEAATEQLPFVSIGSGQPIADPFLAFLRRIFWPTRLPSLTEGVLATLWSLRHAINTNAGGVADPVQIMTLNTAGAVQELDTNDLAEHDQAIEAAERALASFRENITSCPVEEPPVPG
jgi:hypothetical protein